MVRSTVQVESMNKSLAFFVIVAVLGSMSSPAQEKAPEIAQPTVGADGTVHAPAMSIPPSSYMSEEAKQAFAKRPFGALEDFDWDAVKKLSPDQQAAKTRELVDNWARPCVERSKAMYPVNIREQEIAGVRTDIIEPKQGVPARNRERVLISLHGGGYFYFAGGLARLMEALPIAGYGKIKVVSVDYRESPKYKFPAATEDAVAVYRELLKSYKPKNIGIYGCSTGAHLTSSVIVWLQKEKLPRPGAIGLFCQGATNDDVEEGDSHFIGAALMGEKIPAVNEFAMNEPYMAGTNPNDPLVAPTVSLDVLSKFPPTLLISGTRDQELSSVLYTHARLIKVGVETDLHVWDGMWHFFFEDVDLPESKEAYDVIARFFDRNLGQK